MLTSSIFSHSFSVSSSVAPSRYIIIRSVVYSASCPALSRGK